MKTSGENEKEIYDILASLPIDLKRVSLLGDATFEAQLLLRSRFVSKIELDFSKFLNIKEFNKYGEILLITEIEDKRFIIYIESDKVVSVAYSEPKSGYRYAGVKALALLLQILKLKPLSFKLFEIQKEADDSTREVQYKSIKTPPRLETPPSMNTATIKKGAEKPVTIVFVEKLSEFQKRARKLVEELTATHGCQLVDFKFNLSRGVINVTVSVKKRLFTKCRVEDLKKNVMKDLELLQDMYDLAFPIHIEVVVL